ncbi:hypothetical protein Sked_15660 [Sanguibacter keddieii DSM 10542]|uniref:DUF4349 domain-containing protein n=1 Tax=Sanguibacter keddieii (strain ATCC 51767 / DSM 10542 / NCFB 3025 / ST-74) TaxID=446469 RepID=D1BFZ0_SANKS|nr:DUF4349 domain-containing protein [Sanguibacter keddieii]ACZ21501.1 hypothetical protein Sked_15660 [Sanguibacter keddieii DSM 10542]
MTTRRGAQAGILRWAAVGVLAAATGLAGCSSDAGSQATSADAALPESVDSDSQPGDAADESAALPEDLAASVGGADVDRSVIVSGTVVLTADEPITVAGSIVTAVEGAGGYVDGRSESQGSGVDGDASEPERAWLTVRVPPGEVQPMIDALREIGEVTSVDLTSSDVTKQVADLETRISAKRVAITRLEELLTSAGTVADLLAVEGELTTRQSELEQLLTEQAGIDDLTAMATLEISVYATDQAPEQETEVTGFVGGLSAGWDGLLTALGATVTVIGVLLPWAVLVGAVGAVVLWTLRRRRRSSGAVPAERGTASEGDAAAEQQASEKD